MNPSFSVNTQNLLRSKQRKGIAVLGVKIGLRLIKKKLCFHKWSKHVVKVIFWRFLKKMKSPEPRLFQGFFKDFEGKIFGLVNAVSRSVLQRFFV